jgi:hypothetical protein
LSLALCSGSSWEISTGERLKKAISDPLANPETISKKAAKTAADITPNVGAISSTSDMEFRILSILKSNDI